MYNNTKKCGIVRILLLTLPINFDIINMFVQRFLIKTVFGGYTMEYLKKYRHFILFVFDLIMVMAAHLLAVLFLPGMTGKPFANYLSYETAFCVVIVHMACFVIFRIYRCIWRYARAKQLILCAAANFTAEILLFGIVHISPRGNIYPIWFFVIQFMIATLLMLMSRIIYVFLTGINRANPTVEAAEKKERLMIIGAGNMATIFFDDLGKSIADIYEPICIIDDDITKHGRYLRGVKVYGGTDDIVRVAQEEKIDTIIFCIKNIDDENRKRILKICSDTNCHVSKMMIGVNNNLSYSIQKISIDDLLGRKAITIQNDQLLDFINGKVVMVTGGGGSIGSELCRHIASLSPKKLIIVDNYENNAYEIQQELIRKYGREFPLYTEIASVCDRDKMRKLFDTYRPEIVYHAAAHKHVPLMEHNPEEAVKNNIFGTYTVAKTADEFGVKRFVMVSTDKAVNPTNIMGATKRCCEMIIQSMDKVSKTEFVAVRFGNVLGSNGSVIPLFEEQILAGGPVTVTHPEIIRYFMTIPEAVQLLLAAGSMAKGGEIFILDMGEPVKIVDLATQLIKLSGLIPGKDIEIKYTGLRPGEKLYEELLLSEEGIKKTSNEKIFIGNPISIDVDKFFAQLEELKKEAYANHSDKLKNMMESIVPTYHRTDNATA